MSKRMDARHIEREKLLFRYSSALQRGDFEVVEAVLLEAQHDPTLDDLIAELNAAYEAELSAAHTILSPNHRYREDESVNISVTRPTSSTTRMKAIPITLAAAVLAVVMIGSLLLTLRSGGQAPDNLAAIEALTASPTSTPFPATPVQLEPLPSGTWVGILPEGGVAPCPQVSTTPDVGINPLYLTATAVVGEMTRIACDETAYIIYVTATPAIDDMQMTACPPTPVPTATLIPASANPPLDPIQMTATAMVAQATALAQNPCNPQAVNADVPYVPPPATPTAALIRMGVAALNVSAGNIPAGTVVKLNSAYYTGSEWIYQISTMDNAISADVPESALVAVVSPTPVPGAGSFEPTLPPPYTFTPTPVPAQIDPVTGVIPVVVTATPFPFGGVTYPESVFQCRVRVYYGGNESAPVYSTASNSSVVVGSIPFGYTGGVLVQQLNEGRLWYLVVAQIDSVVTVTGWVSDLYVTQLSQCPPVNPDTGITYGTATPTIPPITDLGAVIPLCHVVNPSVATLRLRPEPSDSSTAISGFIAPHIGANVLVQQRDLTHSAIYYLVTVQINDGSMLGWLNARDVLPVDRCPSPESNTGLATVSVIAPLNVDPTTGVDVYTTQPIISNSYGGSVQVIAAEFDGEQWTYQVQSYDPNIAPVTAQAYQLKYQYREQTPICNAVNISGTILPIYTEPDPASVLAGTFSTQGGASFPVRDVQQGSDGQLWVQVRGSNYLGWMPVQGLSLIGSGCPQAEPVIATACLSNQVMNASVRLLEIYSDTSIQSTVIGSLTPGNIATVMDSKAQGGGQTWLLISITLSGSSINGWIQADGIVNLPCTPPETFLAAPDAVSAICRVFNAGNDSAPVRNEPSSTAMNVGVLPVSAVADVVRQMRGEDGRVWFYVSVIVGPSATITGWVRVDTVTQVDTCLPLNESATPTPVSP